MFTGDADLNPGPGVSVLALGDRNPIPRRLHEGDRLWLTFAKSRIENACREPNREERK
jgi:hypothetical protein